jgi:hypothetical protein
MHREKYYKGTKFNPRLGQHTGIQSKLFATFKQNASSYITEDNKTKDEKAEETTRDHYIQFKVYETGRVQQVAKLRFS